MCIRGLNYPNIPISAEGLLYKINATVNTFVSSTITPTIIPIEYFLNT